MERSLILFKQPDMLIPTKTLVGVLSLGPTCLGLAAGSVDDKGPFLQMDHISDLAEIGETPEQILAVIEEAQKQFEKSPLLMYFGDNSGVVTVGPDNIVDTPDMQPFLIIQDDKDRVQLAACLLGNFEDYAKAGDGNQQPHTAEHFAVHEDLMPTLLELYNDSSMDVKSVMSKIRGRQSLLKQMKAMMNDEQGVILLMASDGDMLPITKQDGVLHQTDWGVTTHVFGEETKETKETPVEPKKKMGGLLARTASALKPNGDKSKLSLPKTDTAVKPPVTEEGLPEGITIENGVKYAKCPVSSWSKNQKRDWYLKHTGMVPQQYKTCPKIEVKAKPADPKDLKQLDKVIEQQTNGTHVIKEKDVEPHVVKSEHARPVSKELLGVLPGQMKTALKSDPVIMKALDKNSQKIPSLEELDADEAKYPSLEEQTTISLNDVASWKDETILHFIRHYDQGALVLIKSLLSYRIRKEAEGKKTSDTTVAPKEETKKKGGLLARARM